MAYHFQDLRLEYGGRYSLKDMTAENRKKMIDGLKAAFRIGSDFELEFSCFETFATPWPYCKNVHSVSTRRLKITDRTAPPKARKIVSDHGVNG